MGEDKNRVEYMASINKARSRKRKPPYGTYAAIAAGCVLLFTGVVFGLYPPETCPGLEAPVGVTGVG